MGYVTTPGDEERFAHPSGGDDCTSVHLSSRLWRELLTGRSAPTVVHLDARIDLAHRLLVRAAQRGDVASPPPNGWSAWWLWRPARPWTHPTGPAGGGGCPHGAARRRAAHRRTGAAGALDRRVPVPAESVVPGAGRGAADPLPQPAAGGPGTGPADRGAASLAALATELASPTRRT
ncbi:hypothetical protein NKG94_46185 [Micromonospora sp. M12]